MDKADILLTALDQKQIAKTVTSHSNRNTTTTVLEMTELTEKPVAGEWHNVGVYGDKYRVTMRFVETKKKEDGSKSDSSESGSESGRVEVQLRSTSKEAIKHFAQTCHQWYIEQLQSLETNDRFIFDLMTLVGTSQPTFQPYKLGGRRHLTRSSAVPARSCSA